ncbi:hypothetical protein D3H65_30680 [Paraflavitalea soli]|uniref:Uncharacterized protein n=1 Tax=Paraflavitalea soli TaxID=2315862 RepID=A0A3B7MX87_9BACT|nr:hypothetical protein [Paraflavitalea soli]AXY78093.1 hypothetical protein D3H65_30680 [Paraflavitalea soli]
MKPKKITRVTKRCIPGVTLHPREGYYQVRHIGLTPQRVKTDPAFAPTRRQAARFAHIIKCAKAIADALLPQTNKQHIMPRLIACLRKSVSNEQLLSPELAVNQWEALRQFECSQQYPLHKVLKLDYPYTVDTLQPKCTLVLPACIPTAVIESPPGATYARIVAIQACLDLQQHTIQRTMAHTTIFPLKPLHIRPAALITEINSPNGTHHFLALSIQWYARHNSNNTLQPLSLPVSAAIIKTWIS